MENLNDIPNPFDPIIKRLAAIEQHLAQIEKSILSNRSTEDDITDINGAMELTGKAKQTLYTHVSQNIIPHFKRGNKLYFSKKALREWIVSGKVHSKSEIDNMI